MFPRSYFPSHHFAPRYWGEGGAETPPTPTPTGSKGRRLARWVINAPWIPSPVAEWVRAREDEEELFILG